MNRFTLGIAGALMSLGAHTNTVAAPPEKINDIIAETRKKASNAHWGIHGISNDYVLVMPTESRWNPYVIDCQKVNKFAENAIHREIEGCEHRDVLPRLLPSETTLVQLGNEQVISMQFEDPLTEEKLRVILPKGAKPPYIRKPNQLRQTPDTHISRPR